MKAVMILLILILSVVCVRASSTCSAHITAAPRASSSWTDGYTHYQVYDITVTNDGTCTLTHITGLFNAMEGVITEAWNYHIGSGNISGYGGKLEAGHVFRGAGFVLANASAPALATNWPICDDHCDAPTPTAAPASTTAAPATEAPTTAAPATAAPSTAAPTVPCNISIDVVKDDHSWIDAQGRNTSVYRVMLKNNGPCHLTSFSVNLSFAPGTLISSWNLSPVTLEVGAYVVGGYGERVAAGARYDGAGVIVASASMGVRATTYKAVCHC